MAETVGAANGQWSRQPARTFIAGTWGGKMASATILDEIMRICRGGQGQTDAVRKRRLATFLRRLRVEQPTDRTTWLNHPDCDALVIREEDWVAKERASLARKRERRQVAA